MIRLALASPFGFLVGLSLGALGGGGAILTVPLLVHGASMDLAAASTVSLLVVGPVAAWGAVSHWRCGRVRVAQGVAFGLVGLCGSLAGTSLSRSTDPDLLLLLFSALMVVAAGALFRKARGNGLEGLSVDVPPASAVGDGATLEPGGELGRARYLLRLILVGTVVGFVTGYFGVGGGFVVVPALVVALGFSMPEAVGTSLVVIAINCAVALVPRLGMGEVPWVVVSVLLLAALVGAGVGNRAAGRVAPRTLAGWSAALILVLGAYTAISSAAALT